MSGAFESWLPGPFRRPGPLGLPGLVLAAGLPLGLAHRIGLYCPGCPHRLPIKSLHFLLRKKPVFLNFNS